MSAPIELSHTYREVKRFQIGGGDVAAAFVPSFPPLFWGRRGEGEGGHVSGPYVRMGKTT